ncbi:putative ABC transporter ATP-binding protein YxlF [Pseudomonas syringae pv. actinidiae]|uniref:ATPase component n=1 Tax=Pseudomonas syringae pv. actinidiae TaxID=103796 RepID=A0AAN4TLZ1_PSESF|nr:branched-chain amino acid ABC transporter ATP-binding protein [Pseudomonas syringae pv. actinidiae ICMP 18886]EPN67563.1 branched-chain amino acid ABC transporter ATP-binding protein [Pseudomonas syringae pv. actinidiae ICMP 19101]EPN69515.1 branched-chain amino acid ABC transporter ATP-binding protein [Pseudomonas syringae pv. actinidiae ICMP 19079]EPN76792.1 branched-chain amino acid ABC transporter ATP-binding protein [Pseudomonas syringae pv. actinidiae ICMP 18801]EPN80262.1 branched-cha
MSAMLLSVEDLTVSFDGFKAVDSLNFYVEENQVHVVIGPNGAGKTTLLDMICGKTRPSAGRIRFKDLQLENMIEYQITRAGVGRKFQNPSVYEDLTVRENLDISSPDKRGIFNCLFAGKNAALNSEIEQTAEMIFLKDQLGRKAGLLSHGQKQWLEIGMLLMQRPELLLLDEPVAGMSAGEREKTAELLKLIAKGRAMVIIEHDMEFVKSVADKVTVLHQGKTLPTARWIRYRKILASSTSIWGTEHAECLQPQRVLRRQPRAARPQPGPCARRIAGDHGPQRHGQDHAVAQPGGHAADP